MHLNSNFAKHLYLLIVFFSYYSTFGQNTFIVLDSTQRSGIKLIPGTAKQNSMLVKEQKKNEIVEYSPNEVAAYGFKNGQLYDSRKIIVDGKQKQVFLEKISSGDLTLYYYRSNENKSYYIFSDSSTLIELHKSQNQYKRQLTALSSQGCIDKTAVQVTRFKKNALSLLFNRINNCDQRPIPYPKIGVTLGIGALTYRLPEYSHTYDLSFLEPSTSLSPVLGIRLDIPIEASALSVYSGANIMQTGFSTNTQKGNTEYDMVLNTTVLEFPCLLKYTIIKPNLQPYFYLGGGASINVNTSTSFFATTTEGDIVTINKVDDEMLSDYMFGFIGGVGLQHHLKSRNNLFCELRYDYYLGQHNTLSYSGLSLSIGYTF